MSGGLLVVRKARQSGVKPPHDSLTTAPPWIFPSTNGAFTPACILQRLTNHEVQSYAAA
jgi:hypothetical protein